MKRPLTTLALLAVLGLGGCYHARIETGLTPSAQVIDRPFASSWIYGLVPPNTVRAGADCPNGIASVETQLSFVNQVVTFVTFGIYTPMSIRVTCAAGGGAGSLDIGTGALYLARGSSSEHVINVFSLAADFAAETGQPVLVQFAE